MINRYRAVLFSAFVTLSVLSFVLSGCLPETQRVVVRPGEPVRASLPQVPAEELERRITCLENMLQENGLDPADREIALDLVETYQRLKVTTGDPVRLLFHRLVDLEQRYFSERTRSMAGLKAAPPPGFFEQRRLILEAYRSGDYQTVIHRCRDLESSFGPDAVTPEIGLLLSLSLAGTGMFEEAEQVGKKVTARLEGTPHLLDLRSRMVAWQLELGKTSEAVETYNALSDLMTDINALYGRATQEMKQAHAPAAAPEAPLPEQVAAIAEREDPTAEMLRRVDGMIQKKDFDGAKLFLIRRRLVAREGAETETIDRALRTVEVAEENFRVREHEQATLKKETLDLAKKFIEGEDFEGAIDKLDELGDDIGAASQRKALRDIAVEKLINRDRNKAARLFLRAKQNDDHFKKKELLLSSRAILNNLVELYGSHTLISKVKDNLDKVDEELRKLGVN